MIRRLTNSLVELLVVVTAVVLGLRWLWALTQPLLPALLLLVAVAAVVVASRYHRDRW